PIERLVIGKIIAVMMGDRNDYFLALLITGGEDRAVLCDDQLSVTADKLDILVAHQRARQQADFGENLESVTDAKDFYAFLRRLDNLTNDVGARSHCAGTQIVAIRKTAGKRDNIQSIRQSAIAVPDHV